MERSDVKFNVKTSVKYQVQVREHINKTKSRKITKLMMMKMTVMKKMVVMTAMMRMLAKSC